MGTDQVLKLMGEGGIVGILARLRQLYVDIDHLALVAVGIDGSWVEVLSVDVAQFSATRQVPVEDGNMRVVVHPWRPFRAEGGTIGGVGMALEDSCRAR